MHFAILIYDELDSAALHDQYRQAHLDYDEATFAAINRVVGKAVDMLNADKRRYLPYLINDPRHAAALAQYGGLTPDDFHLPRRRYVKAAVLILEINWYRPAIRAPGLGS